MPVTIPTVEDLETFRLELLQEIKVLLAQPSVHHREWLRSSEACRLLTVSPGTLQNLRRKGALPFTKIGSVIYYHYEDIARMLRESKKSTR